MGRRPSLHHAVLAVAPERLDRAVAMFTELGFEFVDIDLDDVGLHVKLDWGRGLEIVSPATDDPENSVRRFLDERGDGVYTLALRVDDASAARTVAGRYGGTVDFAQHRDGDGWELDEIAMTVLDLPVTFLSTDLPD